MVKITFKTLKQEIYYLDVDMNITIGDLKQQLSQFGFEVSVMKLLFKGRILEDDKILSFYNYNAESKDFIVIMIMKKTVVQPEPNNPLNDVQSNDDQSNDDQSNDDYEDVDVNEHPNIAQILSQNPNILLGLIAQHPQMGQLFSQYPNEIQELVSNPNFIQTAMSMGSQGVFGNNPDVLQINITEEERNDINELMSLGFTENEVIQVYFACNKNKEQAATMLFEEQ